VLLDECVDWPRACGSRSDAHRDRELADRLVGMEQIEAGLTETTDAGKINRNACETPH
jgi:hypothetical protein